MKYIPALDGIRALSVLIVLISHAGFGHIVPGGLGVTVFFFLSGYLITTLSLKEYDKNGRIHLPYFYCRRFFRLSPPLLITLIIAYSLVIIGVLPGQATVQGVLAQLFYFANYFAIFFNGSAYIPEGTGILWSLAVEEHFYLVYPLLMVVFLGWGKLKGFVWFLVALCFAVLLWRFYLVSGEDFQSYRTYYATDTRIDSILYGCLLAISYNPLKVQENRHLSIRHWLLLVGCSAAIVFSIVYRDPIFRETWRYSVQGLGLFGLFYLAVAKYQHGLFSFLNWSFLRLIGRYSYSMYLIHFIIIKASEYQGVEHPLTLLGIALFGSLVFGFIIDNTVDKFGLRLRHRFRV